MLRRFRSHNGGAEQPDINARAPGVGDANGASVGTERSWFHFNAMSLESEEAARNAFIDQEQTVAVIAALFMTIGLAALFLPPSDFNASNVPNEGQTFTDVVVFAFVLLNTVSASFSACALMRAFYHVRLLYCAPVAAADEIIDAFVIAFNSFNLLRISYFSLLLAVPFGVYLVYGLALAITVFVVFLIATLTSERINSINLTRTSQILRGKTYSRRSVLLQARDVATPPRPAGNAVMNTVV